MGYDYKFQYFFGFNINLDTRLAKPNYPLINNRHPYLSTKTKMDKRLTEQLNFRVIAKQVKNLEKILHSVSYAVLACYDNISNMWTYLKFKGPLFLVEDKLKQKKIVILNQCSTKDYIQPVMESYHYQIKEVPGNGFMINFGVQDSITGWTVKGIWSQDENLKNVFKSITQK